eukprot:TRINITY_DN74384_c0_g1_i1.p1 TRINITY_DN74384_c0_g1~~TRINITY_DN74384_c0_g1_i1.p1  ORF type:complete len:1120 (+),score=275.72 TRINITY_DN74384_c0_g1_i1:143-3502(+)
MSSGKYPPRFNGKGERRRPDRPPIGERTSHSGSPHADAVEEHRPRGGMPRNGGSRSGHNMGQSSPDLWAATQEETMVHFHKSFGVMQEIFDHRDFTTLGEELQQCASEGVPYGTTPVPQFLDLGCAPGGFSACMLQDHMLGPNSIGYGVSLPPHLGGFHMVYASDRLFVQLEDMLTLDSTDLLCQDNSVHLATADAQNLMNMQKPRPGLAQYSGVKAKSKALGIWALTVKECLLAFSKLRQGGTFLFRFGWRGVGGEDVNFHPSGEQVHPALLAKYLEEEEWYKALTYWLFTVLKSLFREMRPFKSEYVHQADVSFYMVCRSFDREKYESKHWPAKLQRAFDELSNREDEAALVAGITAGISEGAKAQIDSQLELVGRMRAIGIQSRKVTNPDSFDKGWSSRKADDSSKSTDVSTVAEDGSVSSSSLPQASEGEKAAAATNAGSIPSTKEEDRSYQKKGEAKAVGKVEGKGADSKGDWKRDWKADWKGDWKGERKGDRKGDSKGDRKGEGKNDVRTSWTWDSKADGKGDRKGEGKSESKGDWKWDRKADGKGDWTSSGKADWKYDSKADGKGDRKGEGKSDGKGKGKGDRYAAETARLRIRENAFAERSQRDGGEREQQQPKTWQPKEPVEVLHSQTWSTAEDDPWETPKIFGAASNVPAVQVYRGRDVPHESMMMHHDYEHDGYDGRHHDGGGGGMRAHDESSYSEHMNSAAYHHWPHAGDGGGAEQHGEDHMRQQMAYAGHHYHNAWHADVSSIGHHTDHGLGMDSAWSHTGHAEDWSWMHTSADDSQTSHMHMDAASGGNIGEYGSSMSTAWMTIPPPPEHAAPEVLPAQCKAPEEELPTRGEVAAAPAETTRSLIAELLRDSPRVAAKDKALQDAGGASSPGAVDTKEENRRSPRAKARREEAPETEVRAEPSKPATSSSDTGIEKPPEPAEAADEAWREVPPRRKAAAATAAAAAPQPQKPADSSKPGARASAANDKRNLFAAGDESSVSSEAESEDGKRGGFQQKRRSGRSVRERRVGREQRNATLLKNTCGGDRGDVSEMECDSVSAWVPFLNPNGQALLRNFAYELRNGDAPLHLTRFGLFCAMAWSMNSIIFSVSRIFGGAADGLVADAV